MPPRRTVLRAAGLAGLSAVAGIGLAGCGIRLEDDAPTIPFVSRQPIPDEALLVAAYRRATALAGVAGRATGVPLAPEVTQRHTRQAQVLRAILETGQVPERIISGPPGSTATATSGPTAPVDGTATTASTSAPTNAVPPPVTAGELAARLATPPMPRSRLPGRSSPSEPWVSPSPPMTLRARPASRRRPSGRPATRCPPPSPRRWWG